jgi:hypothetical protein
MTYDYTAVIGVASLVWVKEYSYSWYQNEFGDEIKTIFP